MKHVFKRFLSILTCSIISFNSQGQVTVTNPANTTPNLAATYTSLENALTALNTITAISGPVTISLDAGNPQTAPVGGYVINFATITNTATSPVTISGSGNTITAFSPQASGLLTDAIFKIIGADYITIQNFIMQENSSNTSATPASNNMTEWGVALLYKINTNGAQNNTIQNNTISLNKVYVNTFGIYSNVRHNSTVVGTTADIINATTAPNKGNKVYGNSVSNVNMGITFIGSSNSAYMDVGNDIGGNTSTLGNAISNWGSNGVSSGYVSNSGCYHGIFVSNQKNETVVFNIIVSAALSGITAPIRGIYKAYGNTSATGNFVSEIKNNTITLTSNLPYTSLVPLCGIYADGNGSAFATLNITGNLLLNSSIQMSTTNTAMYGINTNSTIGVLNINTNIVRGYSSTNGRATFCGIRVDAAVSNSLTMNNNSIGDALGAAVTYSASTAGILIGGINNYGACPNVSISNNNLQGFVESAGGLSHHSYITDSNPSTATITVNINGNTFTNIVVTTTISVHFISRGAVSFLNAGSIYNVNNNSIVGGFTKTSASGDVYLCFSSGNQRSGNTVITTGNNFSNISVTGATNINGCYDMEGLTNDAPQKIFAYNTFSNWVCGSGSVTVITVDRGTNTNISYNTISDVSASGSITGILTGANNKGVLSCQENAISSILSSASLVVGISWGTTGAATSNVENNRIYGISSTASRGIRITANGPEVNVRKNKIYGISSPSGTVSGIEWSSVAINCAGNISNNLIGNLSTINSSNTVAIAGIRISSAGTFSTFNIHYNSIYFTASSTGANFGTAGLYFLSGSTATTGMLKLRNNLIINTSIAKGTGKTTSLQSSSSSLANYDIASSNNNVFYSGVPSALNLIFRDGTNNVQTISEFKLRVSPGDNLSTSSFPNFASVTGSDPNFLHLATTGNCGIANGGNNAGILLATDYSGDVRSVISPFVTDIGADEVSKLNVWTGATASWNSSANWSLGTVPDATDINVYIPSAPVNQPSIASGETFGVSNLMLQSGASVANTGSIRIAEKIYASSGSINNMPSGTVEGSLEINGGCPVAQALQGNLFVNNNLKNFRIGKSVSISSAAGEGLNISRELSFAGTGTTFTTGNNLTLISSVDATANVADVTGNSIVGDVTVERYVNTGLASGQHLRSWQLVATPVAGQTIFDSWQEAGLVPPAMPLGLGTIISGPTGGNFDATDLDNPSMKYFDASLGTSGSFVNITNTVAPLYNQRGYFLFVRGDRTANALASTPTPTKLRSKGPLFQPVNPPPVTTVLAGRPASVGNPYASAIDLNYMKNNGLFAGLNNDVIVWDPWLPGSQNVGGYQTLSAANNYIPTAGGTPYYPAGVPSPFMQSGQAFFVQSSGAAGSVTFTEACKSSNNTLLLRQASVTNRHYFRANLITNTGMPADGNAVVFGNSYANVINADDAVKMLNPGENFIITRQNKNLAVETRSNIGQKDTIFYTLNNLEKQTYRLLFAPENMAEPGLHAYFVDKYLSKTIALSLTDNNVFNFVVTSDKLSYKDRFIVVFERGSSIITGTKDRESEAAASFVVYPNPVENKTINIRFDNVPTGPCKLELINTAGQLVYATNIKIADGHNVQSFRIRNNVASGNYKLIIVSEEGRQFVQHIVIK